VAAQPPKVPACEAEPLPAIPLTFSDPQLADSLNCARMRQCKAACCSCLPRSSKQSGRVTLASLFVFLVNAGRTRRGRRVGAMTVDAPAVSGRGTKYDHRSQDARRSALASMLVKAQDQAVPVDPRSLRVGPGTRDRRTRVSPGSGRGRVRPPARAVVSDSFDRGEPYAGV